MKLIQLPNRKCVLHINMLKRFYERKATIRVVPLVEVDEDEDNIAFLEDLELDR